MRVNVRDLGLRFCDLFDQLWLWKDVFETNRILKTYLSFLYILLRKFHLLCIENFALSEIGEVMWRQLSLVWLEDLRIRVTCELKIKFYFVNSDKLWNRWSPNFYLNPFNQKYRGPAIRVYGSNKPERYVRHHL